MTTNTGSADRILRIAIGIAAITAGIYFQSWWGALGVVPLGTALMGWCPLYRVFGISTCALRSGA